MSEGNLLLKGRGFPYFQEPKTVANPAPAKHNHVEAPLTLVFDDTLVHPVGLVTRLQQHDSSRSTCLDTDKLIGEAAGRIEELQKQLTAAADDTIRLNWVEQQSVEDFPWIARQSSLGSGFRVHQDYFGEPTARAAIDAAMKESA